MKLPKADIKSFSEERENVNTKKKTLYDLKLFEKWRELQEIPATELQQFMIKFVLGVCMRTKNVYIINRKLPSGLKI